MKVCVLNKKDEVIALLEVVDVGNEYPIARILEGGNEIHSEMRVKEVKMNKRSG